MKPIFDHLWILAIVFIGCALLPAPPAGGSDLAAQPVELGRVKWHTHMDKAVTIARQQQKPVLVLFQEVPGCSTASGYGRNVLSQPLLVESIEQHFVPLLVYNNRQGYHRQLLEAFGEPAWNNPVVRIIDADLAPLAPRLAGDYTPQGLARQMITAMENTQQPVPDALRKWLPDPQP